MAAIEDPLRGRIAYDGTKTPLKTALFVVVCLAWLLPGLVGHDPWKVDEAVAFGLVSEMVRTGDWVQFRIAGELFLDKAPLFVWTAAAFAKALGGLIPLHDAARLATGLYVGLTLCVLSLAARELMGERAIRMCVLLFIGCLGLLIRAHEMTTDIAGLAGVALSLYGLALAARRATLGGVIAGVGIGMAFLGDGFLPLATGLVLLAVLPLASPLWRTRGYALTAGIAIAAAIPVIAIWPLALSSRPLALDLWLANARDMYAGLSLGGFGLLYYAKILPWYTWPAWPLAAWSIWRARRTLAQRRELLLPLLAFAAYFVTISVFGDSREVNAMPLLVPLALLGVAELETVPRGAASALDWFGTLTFLLAAALIWTGWVAAMTGRPEFAFAWLQKEVPGFTYKFSFIAFALAAALTLIWLVVVARSLRSTRRAVVNWTAGITMVWMLVMTLGVPLVDQARSYREVAKRIVESLPPNVTCVARRNIGDAQRALLDYFVNLTTVREDDPRSARCHALLVQATLGRPVAAGPEWAEAWRGSRPGDRNELFVLYKR